LEFSIGRFAKPLLFRTKPIGIFIKDNKSSLVFPPGEGFISAGPAIEQSRIGIL